MISVMAMAGEGARYKKHGNTPKPLSIIGSMPMFYWAMENVIAETNIFVVKDTHVADYSIDKTIKNFFPNAIIVVQDGMVGGQLVSAMLSESFLQTKEELVVIDCDMSLRVDHQKMSLLDCDAALGTFFSRSKDYSYVVKKDGVVLDIKEKDPISNEAVGGLFYWKHSKDFIKYARMSVARKKMTNGEFYISSAYKEAILEGLLVKTIMSGYGYDLSTDDGSSSFLFSKDIL